MTFTPRVTVDAAAPATSPPRAGPVSRDEPVRLGPMPTRAAMVTHDIGSTTATVGRMFAIVRDVESWPRHLAHYREVRMLERDPDGGGVVEMRADRPFGPARWPTFWRSLMEVDHARPAVRFRHIGGLTTGMEVEWSFAASPASEGPSGATAITLLHLWDGWHVPLVGPAIATTVIGPVFVHGIAARTMAGLVAAAERRP